MIQTFKLLHPEVEYNKSLPYWFKYIITPPKKAICYPLQSDIRKFSFSQRVVEHWNRLPEEIISAKDVREFDNKLDESWDGQTLKYDGYKSEMKYINDKNN